MGEKLILNPCVFYVPGINPEVLAPRKYSGITYRFPRVNKDHFSPRPLAKDPFLASEDELTFFPEINSALIFPLSRTGTGEGFIFVPNPPVFDLKETPWILCWEAFFEEFKHRQPQPWPRIKPGIDQLVRQSSRLSEFGKQILLRIPLADLMEAAYSSPNGPEILKDMDFLQSFTPLVGARGAVGATEKEIILLFPLPLGMGPDLYISQCLDFIRNTFGIQESLVLKASVEEKPLVSGDGGL